MLVNLKENKRGSKAAKKALRKFIQSREYYGSRKEVKRMPVSFKETFLPYKPFGEEYVPDDRTDFTGVYFCRHLLTEDAINHLTNTTVKESFVDYGCVDNASQAIDCFEHHLEMMKELDFDTRGNYVILMTPMFRDRVYSYEEALGSFRWHKNGYYQGKAKVCCEYFLEEPDEKLKLVYSYTVYKVV